MKVYIGPYRNWIGPYQIADLLKHVGVSEDRCHAIGEWLSNTFVNDICEWIDKRRKRKIKVRIDPYDVWSFDNTLALIVLPGLKMLAETKHGSPSVDDSDVPDELKSTNAGPKENTWDTDEFYHDRWTYVLGEMIWAFEQINSDWESQFHTGKFSRESIEVPDTADLPDGPYYEWVKKDDDTSHFDKDGYQAHLDRMRNGFRLFGTYYMGLWD